MTRAFTSGRMALVVVAVLFTSLAPTLAAADNHGAIAFSPVTGAEGYSFDYPSRRAAEARAMGECAKYGGGCRIATWFRNACGALAVGRGNGWGANWGPSRYAAEQAAMRICNRNAPGCSVRRWVCTSR